MTKSNITDFFKGSDGWFSSKRLGYLSTIPVALYGTIWLCDGLIIRGHAELAVEVWKCFLIYSLVLGGFVSIPAIANLIYVLKSTGGKIDSAKLPKLDP